ncbi:MAG: glycine cleavage system protein H [Deltaproteobacteria bacterium]|nr:MAG: glycine cleavage system protein H [Deltaproteobacteria bacterium]
MKEINQLELPENLLYTDQHEWTEKGDIVKIGVTDYAQDQLGDIVFVELPEVGDFVEKGEECLTLESVKAVTEVFSPVSGEIVEINEALEDGPELINEDPYGDGWIFKVKISDSSEFKSLMDKASYFNMLKGA